LINALNELSVKKEQLKNIRKNIKSTQSSLTKNFENIEAKTAAKEDFNKVLTQKEI
jgi:cell division protein ZapA (FtsZ GTPase activity inhibitor)